MDYQHYKGNSLIKIPEKFWNYIHWLRYIGIVLCLFSVIGPLLMILHILESTFFLNCLSFISGFYGVLIWLYGHSLTKARKIKQEDGEAFMASFYEKKRNKS